MKRSMMLALMALMLVLAAGSASAQNEPLILDQEVYVPTPGRGPFYGITENDLRARKLARGVANVVFCIAEIPNQMMQEAHRTTVVTGSLVGAFKGTGRAVQRFAIGLWEVATFFHPGSTNYEPFIEPEIVMMEWVDN